MGFCLWKLVSRQKYKYGAKRRNQFNKKLTNWLQSSTKAFNYRDISLLELWKCRKFNNFFIETKYLTVTDASMDIENRELLNIIDNKLTAELFTLREHSLFLVFWEDFLIY